MTVPAQRTAVPISESRRGDFMSVTGTTNATVYVLNQQADHATSMKLLQGAGLRPYTYQEIIPILIKDEGLKNSLKGKWFYLAGSGTDKDGLYTVDEDGEFAEIGKSRISAEEKVRVWSGKNPLSLNVGSDCGVADVGRRFGLFGAYIGPHHVAPVVVGILNGCEATAPKDGSPIKSMQAESAKMQARKTEINETSGKEDAQLAKRKKELRGVLSKAEQADKASGAFEAVDADDSEKAVMAILRETPKDV